MFNTMNTNDVRQALLGKYKRGEFVIDKTGCMLVEIIGTSFVADEQTIFGKMNWGWTMRELQWYASQSLNINDIPGKIPQSWKDTANPDGWINSNYGWCVWAEENGKQWVNVIEELRRNPQSRRATMIYTRPDMHIDYNACGKNDFICTNAVNYFIRDGELHAVVQMRSNDAVYGYKGDRYWQNYLLRMMAVLLQVDAGNLYWQAASLHVYERHFHLMEEYFIR